MKNIYLLIIGLCLFNSALLAQGSLNTVLEYHWSDSTLPGSTIFNNTYNEVWGFVQGGREYAVIGSTMGTHIFDVNVTSAATQVAFVQGLVANSSIIHRDYHDFNGYLYCVADEGTSSLQILDLSYLPDSVVKVYDSNALIRRAHNIFIDTTTAKMYVCGGYTTSPNSYSVYSLANPTAPVFLKSYSTAGYVHDTYVRNDTAYLNAGPNGLFIVDFSNTANPVALGSLTSYPFQGYNHSGWLNEAGNIYILADENHGMHLKVLDVSDFNNISVLSTIIPPNTTANAIPHNVIIKGSHAYVSYYYDGLQIFDISTPTAPFRSGYYDTSILPNNNSYMGAWGVYPYLPSGKVLVSDMQNGLYIFDVNGALTTIANPVHEDKLQLFPNPTAGMVNILDASTADREVSIAVYDMLGHMVFSLPAATTGMRSLDLSHLANGTYHIVMTGSNIYKHNRVTLAR